MADQSPGIGADPGTAPAPRWTAGRRFGWGLADQLLSSLTNVALGVLVARTVSPDDFGAFTLAFVTYTLALAGARALASEPLMVRYSASSEARWRAGVVLASGTALVLGVAIGVGCLAVGAVTGGTFGPAFAILGLCMPGLLLQDSWRYAFFTAGRGGRAFANDLAWALVLFPAVGVLLATGTGSVATFMLAWGGAASVAAVFGIVQLRAIPQPTRILVWLREQGDLAGRFLAESVVTSGTSQLTLYLVGLVAGLGAVGSLRAGQLLLGPFNLLALAMGLVAVPDAVRTLAHSPRNLRRSAVLYSSALAGGALAWGAAAYALPGGAGRAVLGGNWEGGHGVVIPLAITAAGFGLSFGPSVALRALGAAGRSLRVRATEACITLVAGLGGAAVGGARGVAWSFAVGAAVAVPLWWWQLANALRGQATDLGPVDAGSFYPLA